jgi:hypothetical protein
MSRRSNLFGVGIVSASLPAWADYTALPNGQFIEFTTNTPNDLGMYSSVLSNWTGGTFVPDYGTRGGVVYHGGGEHGTWTDGRTDGGSAAGGVYVLDCDTRQYVRRCFPLSNNIGNNQNPVVGGGGSSGGTPTDDWGAYLSDGSPQSKHTYNSMSYMPAAWGGGSSGSLVRVAHTGGQSMSRFIANGYQFEEIGYSATWRFDLSKANHTAADPSIYKLTGSSYYNYGGVTYPANVNDSSLACIDTTRQGWWSTHRNNVQNGHGGRMAFTSKTGVITGPVGQQHTFSNATLHHFADDDIVISIYDLNYAANEPTNWGVAVWQANTSNAWVQATVNRQVITDVFPTGGRIGMLAYPSIGELQPQWSTILGCFVALDIFYPYGAGGSASAGITTTCRVWKITPPAAGQRFSGTWQITWELVTAKAGTESTNFMNHRNGDATGDYGAMNGTFGRFVECPSLRAFVWTRTVNKVGQLIRLQGM